MELIHPVEMHAINYVIIIYMHIALHTMTQQLILDNLRPEVQSDAKLKWLSIIRLCRYIVRQEY